MRMLQSLAAILSLAPAVWSAEVGMELFTTSGGALRQRVTFDGKEVIAASPLGLEMGGVTLGTKDAITRRTVSGDLTTYAVRHDSGRAWIIETRVFPDGVALRYRIPTVGPTFVTRENTSYVFPSGTTAWYASAVFQYGYTQRYQERKTDTLKGEILAPPATFRLPDGVYAALTEANLWDFHGCVFEGTDPNVVTVMFAECKGGLDEGLKVGMPRRHRNTVVRNHPWTARSKPGADEIVTPWRVLMLAKDLNGLVNNGIIAKVSNPPDPALFPNGGKEPWIRPGRALWTWLAERPNRLGYDTFEALADEAGALGFEAIVLDEGWEKWPQKEKYNPKLKGLNLWEMLAKLCAHARERNVDVWVWRPCVARHSGDWSVVDPVEREAFFSACAKAGVRGLKLDFLHRENVETVDFMETLLRDAAKHRLMVVLHGVNKPTGDAFTYPNLLAKEAVSGLECIGWGERNMAPWAVHDVTLPFTRWLAGPADYTPVNFRSKCHKTLTFGHQVATACIFTSPMLILAADAEDLLNSPARTLFETLPVVWDETRVLEPSAIGRLAVIARRKGNEWWLAAMNGSEVMELRIPLNFLNNGDYCITVTEDAAPERRKLAVREGIVAAGDTLPLMLLSGGGAVIRLTPSAPVER